MVVIGLICFSGGSAEIVISLVEPHKDIICCSKSDSDQTALHPMNQLMTNIKSMNRLAVRVPQAYSKH